MDEAITELWNAMRTRYLETGKPVPIEFMVSFLAAKLPSYQVKSAINKAELYGYIEEVRGYIPGKKE